MHKGRQDRLRHVALPRCLRTPVAKGGARQGSNPRACCPPTPRRIGRDRGARQCFCLVGHRRLASARRLAFTNPPGFNDDAAAP